MCLRIYIYTHNKYIQHTHIYYVNKNFIVDAINRLTALEFCDTIDIVDENFSCLKLINKLKASNWPAQILKKFCKKLTFGQVKICKGLKILTLELYKLNCQQHTPHNILWITPIYSAMILQGCLVSLRCVEKIHSSYW